MRLVSVHKLTRHSVPNTDDFVFQGVVDSPSVCVCVRALACVRTCLGKDVVVLRRGSTGLRSCGRKRGYLGRIGHSGAKSGRLRRASDDSGKHVPPQALRALQGVIKAVACNSLKEFISIYKVN